MLLVGLLWVCLTPMAHALVRVDLLDGTTEDDLFLDSLRVKEEFEARVYSDAFVDVPKGHWAYNAVERLSNLGLLEGYQGRDLFHGEALVTRYEMAAMIARMVDRYIDLKSEGLIRIGKVPEVYPTSPDPFLRAGVKRMQTAAAPPVAKPVEEKKEAPKAKKEVVMEQTDVTKLEELVNGFSKELKDLKSQVRKDLAAGKKVSLKNQRDIKSLQEENQRFQWKGRTELNYVNQGELDSNTLVDWEHRLELDIISKPQPSEDFTIGATLATSTDLGGRKGFEGIHDGSSTAMSLDKLYVNYLNPRARTTERNVYLRKVDLGNISVDFSPTTAFGTQWEGAQAQFQVHDWSLNVMGARTEHRKGYTDAMGRPFTFLGTDEDGKTDVAVQMHGLPYDRYVYGASLQGQFLGNPLSLLRISQLNLFEDKDSVRICEKIDPASGVCKNYVENGEFYFATASQVGSLANPAFPQNDLVGAGSSPDTVIGQLKVPAEKNKVQSIFLRYPISEKNNLFFTGEYARTKYYRPAFRVVAASNNPSSAENINQEPDVAGADLNKFRDLPEQDWDGNAILALLDWSHGPLKIFPAGYARLSPRFVARYLGLPGLDIDQLLNVGGLPLNVQSLEAWLFAPSYTRPQSKYSVGGLFARIQEVEPIYFDPALITAIPSLSGISSPNLGIVERLNNRRGRLRVNMVNLNGEYYASPRFTLKASYLGADVDLYDGCIDGKGLVKSEGLHGEVLDTGFGDGVANCQGAANFNPELADDTFAPFSVIVKFRTKTLGAQWQASNRATYNINYSISDFINNTSTPAELGPSGIVEGLYNRRTYSVTQAVDYEINNNTSLKMSLERVFDRSGEGSDTPGGAGANPNQLGTISSSVDDYYIFTASVRTEF